MKDGETEIPATEYTVTYSDNINVGTATVTITNNDGGNYTVSGEASFTIEKKAATVTAKAQTVALNGAIDTGISQVTLTNAVSGHTLAAVTLTGSATDNATDSGTIAPSGAKIVSGETDVSANYEITYENGVLTVEKGTPDVTAPVANTLTYNGTEQALVSSGVTSGGTLLYSTEETGTYGETVPTGTNAGTYTVWYKVDGGANYNDAEPQNMEIIIQPKEVTLTWTDTDLTYSGEAQKPAATAGSLISGDECDVTVTGERTDAGTYTATASALSNPNYKLPETVTQEFTIQPKEVTLAWTDTELTYSGEAQKPAATAGSLISGDECDVTVTGEQTGAGTYTATATALSNTNYKLPETVTAEFMIAQKAVTVTAKAQTVSYDGEISAELSQAEASGLLDGHALSAVTLTADTNGKNAGETGEITPSVAVIESGGADVTANYNIAYENGEFTIAPLDISDLCAVSEVEPETYSGGVRTPKPVVTYTKGTEDTADDVTLTEDTDYKLSYTNNKNAAQSDSADAPTVSVTFQGNYSGAASRTFTIAPLDIADAEITLGDALTYTGGEQAQSVSSVKAGTLNALDVTFTVSGDTGTDAGDYTLTVTGTGNFTGTAQKAFAIAQKTVTVTADAQSKTYGEDDPELTYTSSGLVGTDMLTGALTRDEGENAGTYAITQGTLSADDNYTISYTGANLTINAKEVSAPNITVTPDSYVYDGTAKEPEIVVKDGETEIPAAEYTVTYSDNIDAGNANVTITDNDGGNYMVSGAASFTIEKKAAEVTAVGWVGEYDELPHSITVTATEGTVITYSESENGSYTAVNPTYRNVGQFTVYYLVTADEAEIARGHEIVEIRKASIRLQLSLVSRSDNSLSMTSWLYGDVPAIPALTVETVETDAHAFTEYGQIAYSYSPRNENAFEPITPEGLSALPAGAYTMRAEIAETRNLSSAYATADFTITKAYRPNWTAETVTVVAGARDLETDISGYLETGDRCAVSGFDGNLLDGAPEIEGTILRFYAVGATGATDEEPRSGVVRLTVSNDNYQDSVLTVPLKTGGSLTLRFDRMDGGANPAPRTLQAGMVMGTLPVPRRTGYQFEGWYTTNDGGNRATADTVMGNADLTLYAHWTALQHTVTLLLEGGALEAAGWLGEGDARSLSFWTDSDTFLLPTPVKEGHSFTGWTEEEGGGPLLRVSIPQGSTRDFTYRANWTEGSRTGKITLTKDAQSRILGIIDLYQDADATDARTISATESEHILAMMLKELACDDATELTDEQNKSVSVSMNVKVLPALADIRDEDLDESARITKMEQEELSNTAEALQPDVTTEIDFFSIDIEKGVAVAAVDGSETDAAARFSETIRIDEASRVLEIPIRYDLTGRYAPKVFRYHGGTEALERLPTRPEDYQDMDGRYYVSGAGNDAVIYVYSSRFSTYAVTSTDEETYMTLFETNGGTEITPQTVRVRNGARVERPANPTKEGYEFWGWYVTEHCTGTMFSFDADAIQADTTLYAKWIPKIYRVTVIITDESGAVRSVSLSDNGEGIVEDGERNNYRLTIGSYRLNLNLQEQGGFLSHSFSIPRVE